ncbi:hypothetical protein LTR54_017497 [Friedmanniomyces endolithicus]|nr:hypothetical protein LTR54_017497 [Friedmanniomyces endolithicus]
MPSFDTELREALLAYIAADNATPTPSQKQLITSVAPGVSTYFTGIESSNSTLITQGLASIERFNESIAVINQEMLLKANDHTIDIALLPHQLPNGGNMNTLKKHILEFATFLYKTGYVPLALEIKSQVKKSLPIPPVYEILPKASTPPKRTDPLPHVVTQAQGQSVSSNKDLGGKTTLTSIKIDARLEALEKKDAMLSAALVPVLRTNGAANSPLSALAAEPDSPLGWENRVARRSAASQSASRAASSSNGSALEMYMSTKRDI